MSKKYCIVFEKPVNTEVEMNVPMKKSLFVSMKKAFAWLVFKRVVNQAFMGLTFVLFGSCSLGLWLKLMTNEQTLIIMMVWVALGKIIFIVSLIGALNLHLIDEYLSQRALNIEKRYPDLLKAKD